MNAMSDPLPRPSPPNRLVHRRLPGWFGPVLAAALIGACNPAAPTASPSGAQASVASAESSATPSGPITSPAPAAGQTDTDWGRIWDALPAAFPVYPGATPAEEVETGPVSGAVVVEGRDARTIATWMQAELERAAYATEALNGPLEDGSFVLESVGQADCRVEVAVAPLGGLTTVTVRYAATCPSP